MKKFTIYTDGACSGNPGIGSWAAIIVDDKHQVVELSKLNSTQTTNNRMELSAVIEALKSLKEKSEVELFTDSKYVQLGISEWIHKWVKNNWRNASGKQVENQDLWQELLDNTKKHIVNFHWVKGHSNNTLNNQADKLATNLIKNYKTENRKN